MPRIWRAVALRAQSGAARDGTLYAHGRDTIQYEVTIDDPNIYTKPWKLTLLSKDPDARVFEYACHEGNISMSNMLSGARAEEKAAEEAKRQN